MDQKSSRLMVKNIGGHVTEKRLKSHFSQKGVVTDAKIMFKGLSNRHFGFVGFRSEREAEEARSYFDNTFLDTNRITVEFAKPQSDPQLKARKEMIDRKKKDLKRSKKKEIKQEEETKKSKKENDRKKQAFLQDIISGKVSDIVDPKRIFIENLAYTVTQDDIKRHFERYGEIESIKLPKRQDGSLKGNCLLRFETEESATTAIGDTNLEFFMGRKMYVKPGKKGPETKPNQRKQQFEQKQLKGKKDWTKKSEREGGGWSTLYLNSDTVAEVVAEELNVRKGELLRMQGLAVKMAECEAQLLERTKQWIREELEVDPERLNQAPISDRSLLVKSIMKEETQHSLRELFRRYGIVKQVKVAPLNTLAFVEYESSSSAQIALRKLQGFTRKRGPKEIPLYLQYAPKPLEANQEEVKQVQPHEEQESTKGKTLFVKNLNFSTTDEMLRKACSDALKGKGGKIVTAKVVKKRDTQTSAGFGFIETDSQQTARILLRSLEGRIVEQHALQVSMAGKSAKTTKKQKVTREEEKVKPSKKLVIKNVAFEATKKELQEVLGRTGGLVKVRMPKKVGGGHRGFGFAEFTNKEDAQKAIRQTGGTHLYGKRLVVGYAKETLTQ